MLNNKKDEFSYFSAFLHLLIFTLYTAIYLFAFSKIEQRRVAVHIINMPLDNIIPFNEIFIIPYIFWFFYITYFILFYLKRDLTEYYRIGSFLASGMTLFIIISILFPNGLLLRPNLSMLKRENIFINMVNFIYNKDTATNVFPSIHVFNSMGVMLTIFYNKDYIKFSKLQKYFAYVMGILIILSTMFVKQHSMIDVIGAFIMSYIFYKCFFNERYTKFLNNIGFYGIPSKNELFLKTPNEDIL